ETLLHFGGSGPLQRNVPLLVGEQVDDEVDEAAHRLAVERERIVVRGTATHGGQSSQSERRRPSAARSKPRRGKRARWRRAWSSSGTARPIGARTSATPAARTSRSPRRAGTRPSESAARCGGGASRSF